MPDTMRWDMQSRRDPALAFDQTVAVTEYETAGDSPNSNTIAETKSVTTTWTLNMNLGGSIDPESVFWAINGTLGGGYSTANTDTQTYSFGLKPGESARVVYIPRVIHVQGLYTETIGGDPNPEGGPPWTTNIVTIADHVPGEAIIPVPASMKEGDFRLQYAVPTFYTEYEYGGIPYPLDRGNWNRGPDTFPNDAITSMYVPDGYTVQLFFDRDFQGTTGTFGPRDYPNFSAQWAGQVSSIKIW